MRNLVVALAIVLVACGDLQAGSQALAPASPTSFPSLTPLPSGVVDPRPLVQHVTRMSAVVLRVDDIATKLVSGADYLGPDTVAGPQANVPALVWVVAVLGEIHPSFGLLARPNSRCGLFAFRADTGEIWSAVEGHVATCQPYFAYSLTPPDAPVRCAPAAYDNGVPREYMFSPTRPGAIGFTTVRDDRWREPITVPGAFLAHSPEGSVTYEDAFCLKAFVRQGPRVEKMLAAAVGAGPGPVPSLEWTVWLRGYHAVSGSADSAGHIDVVVEPRAGYEWAYFDWQGLVPGGGYVMFRFIDASGREVLPWRLANGP